jgi:divalent metal cation (Fe/Co/Zn/Cd) transporter
MHCSIITDLGSDSVGLLVSGVILQQGYMLLRAAVRELMDAGVSEHTLNSLQRSLQHLLPKQSNSTSFKKSGDLLYITDLRARRCGTNMLVDLSAHVPSHLSVSRVVELEEGIKEALVAKHSEVKEVRVKFIPIKIHNIETPFRTENSMT